MVTDRTASSRQLAARWSTATGVLMLASSIRRRLLHRGLRVRVPLYRIPLTANHRRLHLQWAHKHRAWLADWHQRVIERHSGLTPRVMVWGTISYHGRSNLLRIEGIPGAIFQQDNARPHVANTVRDFCSAQHMQLLLQPTYSSDMLPTEHVLDLVGWRLTRDLRPAASKDKLLLRIQAIWNSFSREDIQNLFDSMSRRIAALIAARGGYIKY
ncbi:transposable element Tcb2 transposase [Trichonephila clavipes]|nr:transposable element Tcb2 transposase [Trichonephila clavipes]